MLATLTPKAPNAPPKAISGKIDASSKLLLLYP